MRTKMILTRPSWLSRSNLRYRPQIVFPEDISVIVVHVVAGTLVDTSHLPFDNVGLSTILWENRSDDMLTECDTSTV